MKKIDGVTVYVPRTHQVQAVQITKDNIRQIAEEIGAEYWEIAEESWGPDYDKRSPRIVAWKTTAFIGDWVVKEGENYNFYNDFEFTKKYQPVREKEARIHALVVEAIQLAKEEAKVVYGGSLSAEQIAGKTSMNIVQL